MNKLKITRKDFRTWLAENPDLRFDRRSSCDCPLAIYLGSGCDQEVSVDVDTTMVNGKTFYNPPWTMNFIAAVDNLPGEITGARALDYL